MSAHLAFWVTLLMPAASPDAEARHVSTTALANKGVPWISVQVLNSEGEPARDKQVVPVFPDATAPIEYSDKSEHGVKSWMVKKATQTLAKGIRAQGDIFHRLFLHLDAKAAAAFKKHSQRIAKELDSIARIPDLTVKIVREKVLTFMTNTLKMNSGTSLMIADTLEGMLWFLM